MVYGMIWLKVDPPIPQMARDVDRELSVGNGDSTMPAPMRDMERRSHVIS